MTSLEFYAVIKHVYILFSCLDVEGIRVKRLSWSCHLPKPSKDSAFISCLGVLLIYYISTVFDFPPTSFTEVMFGNERKADKSSWCLWERKGIILSSLNCFEGFITKINKWISLGIKKTLTSFESFKKTKCWGGRNTPDPLETTIHTLCCRITSLSLTVCWALISSSVSAGFYLHCRHQQMVSKSQWKTDFLKGAQRFLCMARPICVVQWFFFSMLNSVQVKTSKPYMGLLTQ